MNDIADLLSKLYNKLQNQEKLIDRLLAAAETQRQALLKNDLPGIRSSLEALQSGAGDLEATEGERLTIQRELESQLNIGDTTLNKLLPFAAEPLQTELRQQLSALRVKTASLVEVNSGNAVLIKKSLLLNSRLLQLIHGSQPTYGQQGQKSDDLSQVSLINKSV